MLLASASRAILSCGALGLRYSLSRQQWTGCGWHSAFSTGASRDGAGERQRSARGEKGGVLQTSSPAIALAARGADDAEEEDDDRAMKNRTSRGLSARLDLSVEAAQLSPPLDVLHFNQLFAVVCKPPLMHVHRPEFGSKDKEFVMQKARNQLGRRVYLPHRLDRGTSGCLLVGFSPDAVKVLHEALSHPTSVKTYVAIVRGSGQAYIDRGWFTVDRPIKDDKKVLREASTRFLFVKGGDAPDPRCCLVLAQPSTGRFHQIRRHLNGLSHPVVGDSVHGNSRFNREVAGHPSNAAPVGRLMLHCLQLLMPSLPDAASKAWGNSADYATVVIPAEGKQLEEVYGGTMHESEKTGIVGEGNGEPDRGSCGASASASASEQEGMSVSDVVGSASISDGVRTPVEPEEHVSDTSGSIFEEKMVIDGLDGRGLEVYAEPPGDMMTFLRGMSWWEEGMIQAAERSGRHPSPPPL